MLKHPDEKTNRKFLLKKFNMPPIWYFPFNSAIFPMSLFL